MHVRVSLVLCNRHQNTERLCLWFCEVYTVLRLFVCCCILQCCRNHYFLILWHSNTCKSTGTFSCNTRSLQSEAIFHSHIIILGYWLSLVTRYLCYIWYAVKKTGLTSSSLPFSHISYQLRCYGSTIIVGRMFV